MNHKIKIIFCILFLSIYILLPAQQYYTGDGGSGQRIAILEFEPQGLTAEQEYLPAEVQGVLTSLFTRFTAMTVIDRQALERALVEVNRPFYADNLNFGRLPAPPNLVLSGTIRRTASGITLDIRIVDLSNNTTRASHTRTCSQTEIDDHTAIHRAARELMSGLDIELSSAGRTAMSAMETENQRNAQRRVAQGMVASRQGTEIAALTHYLQAAAFDPTLAEAVSRSTILTADIRTGNIAGDVTNDIAWRRAWVDRLTETEQFYHRLLSDMVPPFRMIYWSDILERESDRNYRDETTTLHFDLNMRANPDFFNITLPAIEQATQIVYDGLIATGRASEWGLSNWPNSGVSNSNPYNRNWTYNFNTVFEILNDSNRVIGTSTNNLSRSFNINRSSSIIRSQFDRNSYTTVNFTRVNATQITNRMSIRIRTINNNPPENARITITPVARTWFNTQRNALNNFNIDRHTLRGFSNEGRGSTTLRLPDNVWNEPVIIYTIADGAFNNPNTKLTSITIPNTVTIIGNNAFAYNSLTSLIIPNSVTSIGNSAFEGNSINGLWIGQNMKTIGDRAFYGIIGGYLTIGENVNIGNQAFSRDVRVVINEHGHTRTEPRSTGFAEYYNNNRRQTGTYSYRENRWWFEPTINQHEARDSMDKGVAALHADQAAKRDQTLKDSISSRLFLIGFGFEFGSPPHKAINKIEQEETFGHWVLELGLYKSFIPYTFLGGEARVGWGGIKTGEKGTNSEGKEYKERKTSTMYSFAPSVGVMVPTSDTVRFNLGVLYEMGGQKSKFHKFSYFGCVGFEVGIDFYFEDVGGRGHIRYRGTMIPEDIVNERKARLSNSITFGIGY
ncbi:MAG: leucine-rich repeat domain-containing protein [Candidatus Cloacimonetes bacterium]|nr:leucine-rich repeat domain-containing protein [Candidatus Cloacimonadota bacterium]